MQATSTTGDPLIGRLRLLPRDSDRRAAPGWLDAKVVRHHATTDRYWMLVLNAPQIADGAQPGQFVMVTPARRGENWPVLPRPMAIYATDRVQGTITIVYGTVGDGTRHLTTFEVGETLITVGPLGRSFEIAHDVRSLLLLGRGIGICSLTMLGSVALQRGISVLALSSGRSPQAIVGRDYYRAAGIASHEVYDSNSSSQPDAVSRWLTQHYASDPPGMVAVCGSNRLMSLAEALGDTWDADVQVSLEARMACGLGYCHGCSTGQPGAVLESPLICSDGPVFRLNQAGKSARQ
jgi:dihydroorotate dehydrogenase electron transfer subunit